MEFVWLILLTLLNLGWILAIIVGVPGTWLLLGSCLLANWLLHPAQAANSQHIFGFGVLIALAALALLGEIIEFAAGVAGAKYGGASRRGAWGALVGSIIGAIAAIFLIPIPIFGSLIGAAGGATIGTIWAEISGGRPPDRALHAGVGAGVGRLGGVLGKISIGLVMWGIAAVAAFVP